MAPCGSAFPSLLLTANTDSSFSSFAPLHYGHVGFVELITNVSN
jgi:hypothetical protein